MAGTVGRSTKKNVVNKRLPVSKVFGENRLPLLGLSLPFLSLSF